jgi:hypothetical protein
MSSASSLSLKFREWRQIALISAGAVALYVGVRRLPTGTNLNHIDFRVAGSSSIDFCDPANPQFIPVVAVRSPVSMALVKNEGIEVRSGERVALTFSLITITGKAISPEDLLVAHTKKLHLLIVDPRLQDYQHVHPEPGARPGEWQFSFTPRLAGVYRLFADFTPAATARGLYASVDLDVKPGRRDAPPVPASEPVSAWTATEAGCQFALTPSTGGIRAGVPADLVFTVQRQDKTEVRLQPVMGAYAHLVAFDQGRSGFAHLHPNETDLTRAPDARQPRLTFKVTIPRAGRYVIWAQVNLDGEEVFAPFWFDVSA